MNHIKIKNGKEEYCFNGPSSWDELTKTQLLIALKYLPQYIDGDTCEELLLTMYKVNTTIFNTLSPVQKFGLLSGLDFLLQDPMFSMLVVDSFTHNGIEYIGYHSGFANVTWEEFITAERYFTQNDYKVAAAVLYRQKKEKPISDPRVPFTLYGSEERAAAFKYLDATLITAIALNYSCLRKKYISDRYKHIFKKTNADKTSKFSWINISRSVLGDVFYEEKKLLKSNVHTVLYRMNYLMSPDRKKKK